MYRKAAPLLFLAAFALAPAAFAQDADASAAPLPAWDQLTPAQRDLALLSTSSGCSTVNMRIFPSWPVSAPTM